MPLISFVKLMVKPIVSRIHWWSSRSHGSDGSWSLVDFTSLQFSGSLRGKPRQVDEERTAFAHLTFDPDTAVVQLDNLAANKQAEAGAADSAGGGVVDAVELLE